jgi:signal peptidase
MSEQIDLIENEEKKQQKKKLSAGEVIGIVLCVLLIPILIVNITMIVKGLVNPSKVPSIGGYSPLIVLTDSMYPGIKSGDLIIVKAADAEDVKVGDVIAFFDPDGSGTSVLTHRVVELVTENGTLHFRTKGDANNAEDPSLAPAENLIGVYQSKINGAGNVAMFLQSTPGLIVCIGVPLVLLVGVELLRRKKYDKARNEDTEALLKELEELRARQAESDKEKDKAE